MPSNQISRRAPVGDVPAGMKREVFMKVLVAVYTAYIGRNKQGLPSIAEITTHLSGSKIDEKTVVRVLESREFRAAIEKRGIVWKADYSGLTPQQSLAVSLITDPSDKRSLRTKLKAAGINYDTYRAWMRNPFFKNHIEKVAEDMLQDNLSSVHNALAQKANSGDVNAIKFFYELTGRYNPAAKEAIQVKAVLQQVLEVIQRRVTDPEVLAAIGADFQMIAVGNGIGTGPVHTITQTEPTSSTPVGVLEPSAEPDFQVASTQEDAEAILRARYLNGNDDA